LWDWVRFKLTTSTYSIGLKTLWLILDSPSNPTGSVYNRDEFKALAEALLGHP